jgi:hypothetical protein
MSKPSFLSIRSSVLAASLFTAFFALSSQAANTRVTYPSAVSLEILGRSMLYTVAFDQVVNENLAVGGGFGTVSANDAVTGADLNRSIQMVPVYMNYYLLKEQGTPYFTAGATLVTNHNRVKNSESATGNMKVPNSNVMPTIGAGYENRGDNGFLFRVTAYGVLAKKITPWVGFSFGLGF